MSREESAGEVTTTSSAFCAAVGAPMGMREYFDHFSFFNLSCIYAWGMCIWHIVSSDFSQTRQCQMKLHNGLQSPGLGQESPLYI